MLLRVSKIYSVEPVSWVDCKYYMIINVREVNLISIVLVVDDDEHHFGILSAQESTEAIYGAENIVKRVFESYPSINETLDGCFDHAGL